LAYSSFVIFIFLLFDRKKKLFITEHFLFKKALAFCMKMCYNKITK
jgi:hypothetical protein